ncbi:hypothetical protein [Streptomyces sp. NPDC051662]
MAGSIRKPTAADKREVEDKANREAAKADLAKKMRDKIDGKGKKP